VSDSIRLLVVARQPLRVDDLGLSGVSDVAEIQLIRRPLALELAIEQTQPNVVIVDVGFPEQRGFKAIDQTIAELPDARVLALIEDPPSPADVARAGAHGFVTINSDPAEFEAAVRAVHRGEYWLPDEDTREILGLVAEDLDVTGAERCSRVVSIIVGLIPLAGALAAILALLWRKYLAHIGVRPVDLAIDSATRVVDTVTIALLFLGVFGPVMFISHWLDLASEAAEDHRVLAWVASHRKGSGLILALAWLPVAYVLTVIADLVLILMIGPVVAVSILAWAIDASDMLPTMFRIDGLKPRRVLTGALAAVVLVLTILSVEVLVVGPDLQTDGAHGVFAPKYSDSGRNQCKHSTLMKRGSHAACSI
jgi:CheY-like chemotaxis protein